jgi:hypothetical protein
MLFPSESLRNRIQAVADDAKSRGLPAAETARMLLQVSPDHPGVHQVLAHEALNAGNSEEGERLLWNALQVHPFGALAYASLGGLYRKDPQHEQLGQYLWKLALSAVAALEDVPDDIATLFQEGSGRDLDFHNPGTYRVLVQMAAGSLDELPANDRHRVLPYSVTIDLAQGAAEKLTPESWGNILASAEVCLPVWRAALRAWAIDETETNSNAVLFLIALCGEFAGPDFLDDLWELVALDSDEIFLHANWAVWRMAQRFPVETLARLRAAIPDAPLSVRCSMAEQLGLMSGEVEPALLELVNDFSSLPADGNAAYLLVAAADALAQTGHDGRAQALLVKYERLLDKEGRSWMRDTLESPEGFIPRIVGEGIPELDMEDICLSRVLVNDEEHDHEHYHDDEDDEEEFDEDSDEIVIEHPKPGRNDPCWCGSGQKYKKCHLQKDEEQERMAREGAEADNEDPVRTEAMSALLSTAERLHKRRDMIEAARQYFGDRAREDCMDEESEDFLLWYLFHFRPESTQRTAVEEHLRKYGASLSAEVREMLEAWRDARFGLFELAEARDDGLILKDVFEGGTVKVDGEAAVGQGQYMLARLETVGGTTIFAGDPLQVIDDELPRLLAFIDREIKMTGQTPAQFVQTNSHQLHRVVEGEE